MLLGGSADGKVALAAAFGPAASRRALRGRRREGGRRGWSAGEAGAATTWRRRGDGTPEKLGDALEAARDGGRSKAGG